MAVEMTLYSHLVLGLSTADTGPYVAGVRWQRSAIPEDHHSGLLTRSSSGLIELTFVVKVKVRVRVNRFCIVSRVNCKASASLRISENPGMVDPWNGGPKSV